MFTINIDNSTLLFHWTMNWKSSSTSFFLWRSNRNILEQLLIQSNATFVTNYIFKHIFASKLFRFGDDKITTSSSTLDTTLSSSLEN